MNRNESSRPGDLQSEGNLGNERNRNSDRASRESGRNRSSESSSMERGRESENRESSEDWAPSGGTGDLNDSRRGESER
jgi:hypothetical protein